MKSKKIEMIETLGVGLGGALGDDNFFSKQRTERDLQW